MRTLRRINRFTFAAVLLLILVSGCASNHTLTKAGADSGQPASTGGFAGPEGCIKPPCKNDTRWWEYALMPISVASGALLWYGNLPGIAK